MFTYEVPRNCNLGISIEKGSTDEEIFLEAKSRSKLEKVHMCKVNTHLVLGSSHENPRK